MPEAAIRSLCQEDRYEEATRQALALYGEPIFRYLQRMSDRSSDAEDIFQNFCVDLFLGLPRFEWRASLKTWAYRLAYSALSAFHRSPAQRPVRLIDSEQERKLERLQEEARESTAHYLRTEFKSAIDSIREGLKPEKRSLLILHVDAQLSFPEIATIHLGEAVDEERLKREVLKLRKRFERVKREILKAAMGKGLIEKP